MNLEFGDKYIDFILDINTQNSSNDPENMLNDFQSYLQLIETT